MIDQFTDLKESMVGLTGFSKDALHIHLSLILVAATAWLTKRPLGSWLPWLAALALESTNEALDYLSDPNLADWQLLAMHDLLNTMFWPTALVLAARVTRLRLR